MTGGPRNQSGSSSHRRKRHRHDAVPVTTPNRGPPLQICCSVRAPRRIDFPIETCNWNSCAARLNIASSVPLE